MLAEGPLTPNAAEPPIPDDTGRDELEREPPAATPPLTMDWAQLLAQWGTTLAIGAGALSLIVLVSLSGLLRADLIGLESLGRPGRQLLRWLGRVVPSAVTAAYRELERAARWLGLNLPAHLTPRERALELNLALPDAAPAVDTITAQYMAEQYSPYPEAANGSLAQRAWQGIQRQVWTEGLRRGVGRLIRGWSERLGSGLPK